MCATSPAVPRVSAWLCYSSPSLGQAISGNASTCAPNCLRLQHTYTQPIPLPVRNEPKKKKQRKKKKKNETPPPGQITLIAPKPCPQIRVKYTPGPGAPASPSLACAQARVRTVTSHPMSSLHPSIHPSVLLYISASVVTHPPSTKSPHLAHIIIIIIIIVAPSLATPRGLQHEMLVVPYPEPTPAPADTRTCAPKVSRTQSIPNPDLHVHFTRLVGWLVGWMAG